MKHHSLLLLLSCCAVAYADDAVDNNAELVEESSQIWVSAKSTNRVAPHYPRTELNRGRQAWVQVAFCIDESGTPQNVSILDSVGNTRFEREAIRAVEQWEYEPSLVNGKPTWQSGNSTYITFAIEGGNAGADRKFIGRYNQLGKYIMDENIGQADKLFRDMYDSNKLSLYELSKLWAQRVRYEALGGDMYKLHMALERATASNGEWIEKEEYIRLLVTRIKVETNMGSYLTVMRSYKELIEAAGEEATEVVEFEPLIAQIKDIITNDQILKIEAEVRAKDECSYCDDSWYFRPARNDFAFTNIQGELTSIDMRCNHKRFESKVSEGVEWHIPEAWGSCQVQVYGTPGTTMDVLMLPAQDGA